MVRKRGERNSAAAREGILEQALRISLSTQMTDWTVSDISEQAGCAKGLVLYHFGSKAELILAVADRVRASRTAARIRALEGRGAGALDSLWRTLEEQVREGWTGLWLQLLASPSTRAAASAGADDRRQIDKALAASLDTTAEVLRHAGVVEALDGFELAHLQGSSREAERERYDRYWLGVLDSDTN